MSSITLTSNDFNKISLIENLLFELKISFKKIDEIENKEVIILSDDEIKAIEQGEEEINNGDFISSEEVRKIMRECVK